MKNIFFSIIFFPFFFFLSLRSFPFGNPPRAEAERGRAAPAAQVALRGRSAKGKGGFERVEMPISNPILQPIFILFYYYYF